MFSIYQRWCRIFRFWRFYKNPIVAREAQTIDRAMLLTGWDRRIRKKAEKEDCNVFC